MMRLMIIVTTMISCVHIGISSAGEFRFCVFSENALGSMRVIGDGTLNEDRARDTAEARFCEIECAQVCAALSFNEQRCGNAAEFTYQPFRPQTRYYCESPEGQSLPKKIFAATVRVLVFPDYSNDILTVNNITAEANTFLTRSACPLELKLNQDVSVMPDAFTRLKLRDEESLKTAAKYPGTIKFVNDISYCGDNPSTLALDRNGRESIMECAVPEYVSIFVSKTRSIQLSAILMLKGYGHLANVEPDRDMSVAYTLADPDLLIPESPLLEGRVGEFKITKYQCLKLIKYALESKRITIWKSQPGPK